MALFMVSAPDSEVALQGLWRWLLLRWFRGKQQICGVCASYIGCLAIAQPHDSLAERSKAVAQGAIP